MAKTGIELRKSQLPLDGMATIVRESLAEGYRFVQRLDEEWASGANRFSGEGEALYGAFDGKELVGIGGLNRDPFLNLPDVGRLRRIYVRSTWRKRGVGTALISALLREAANHFREVRLRAENDDAARLYEKLGFVRVDSANATHTLRLF